MDLLRNLKEPVLVLVSPSISVIFLSPKTRSLPSWMSAPLENISNTWSYMEHVTGMINMTETS